MGIEMPKPQPGSRYETILNTALEIVGEAKPEEDPKKVLSTISFPNLEKRLSDEGLSNRDINNILRKKYNGHSTQSPIRTLRNIVKETVYPEHWISSLEISDLKSGVKIEERISFQMAYLLGVYVADISFRRGNNILLSGNTEDEPFYKEIVKPLFKKLYDADITAHVKPRQRIKNEKEYKWKDVYINFGSELHIDFLKSIDFITPDKKIRGLDFEKNIYLMDKKRIDQYKEAYFMGLIAGGGNIGNKKEKGIIKTILEFKNIKKPLASEIIRMLAEINLDHIDYANPDKKPHYLYFNEENMIRLRDHDPRIQIVPNQAGFYTNQKHTGLVHLL